MYDYFISFVLFFFFKQKTAYEMRTSDWSSDVCSSDLYLGANAKDMAGYEKWLGHARPYQLDSRLLDSAEVGALLPESPRRWDEIGRASCRESVCPYV